ncbi:MAG: hypothetical protein M3R02_19680 [Chloroflexota bacterium]|nr:hypothetical protein [Chloroflexota bacterium]
MPAFAHSPSASAPPPRRSSGWALLLLPFTVPLALLRLLARSLARATLALPGERRSRPRVLRTLLGVMGVAIAFRFLLFARFSWRELTYVLDWYWQLTRVLGYPRLLDGFWAEGLAGYTPDTWYSIWRPLVTLTVVWASAIVLLRLVVAALRRGFSPDGTSPLPWPTPTPRSPLGIPANALIIIGWGWLPAGFLLTLPPFVGLVEYAVYSTEAFTRLWSALRWLPYPQILEARADRLSDAALRSSAVWTVREPVDLSAKFNQPLIELVWLELATIGVGVALALSAVWLWQTWSGAARGNRTAAVPLDAGPRRSSPGWTIVLLPITFPLALLGLGLWKSPLWLPGLVAKTLLFWIGGCLLAGAGLVYLTVQGSYDTPLQYIGFLRQEWRALDPYLPYLHWFSPWWEAIPHVKARPPDGGDVARAVVLLCAMVGAAVPPLVFAAQVVLAVCKRTLEAVAR